MYATQPLDTERMPPGIPFIVGNEAAERFSFYGMKAILTVFMTQHLLASSGATDFMGAEQAKGIFHLFTVATYVLPMLGALLSDIFLGKYPTILLLSLGYCGGHAALALGDTALGQGLMEPRHWLYLGLALIALGAGGIKPCVSAHVGDQFGARNQSLLSRAFTWFYLSINVGAMVSFLVTPLLLERYGATLAFGVPGLVMAAALFVFWLGRRRFAHVPPQGARAFWQETIGPDGLRALRNLSLLYLVTAPFWALFDQTGSSWVLQAEQMNREFLGIEWLSSQIGAVNPVLVLLLAPLFSYVVYPFAERFVRVTPLRKMGAGLVLAMASFVLCASVQMQIDAGGAPSIAWQLLAYVLLTSGEVLLSITILEFSYTQAPRRMKSVVMATFFMVSIALGNLFTAAVNFLLAEGAGAGEPQQAGYFWFFAAVMALTSLLFVPVAWRYRGRTFIQGAQAAPAPVS